MRRFVAALGTALALLAGTAGPSAPPAAAQDFPEIRVALTIVNGQFLYRYGGPLRSLPGVGQHFESNQPLWGVAGYIGVPQTAACAPSPVQLCVPYTVPPVYAFDYPTAFWPVIYIDNQDPVPRRIRLCGARKDQPACLPVPDEIGYLVADLAPKSQALPGCPSPSCYIWTPDRDDEEIKKLRGPIFLTDIDQPWTRGLVCFDLWEGLGSRACGNYPRP